MEVNNCKLEKIKSIIILKRIFNHLINHKDLNLINYNKAMQRRMMINIEKYKKEIVDMAINLPKEGDEEDDKEGNDKKEDNNNKEENED